MHKLSETWALAVGVFLQFFSYFNNEILTKIVNLLTIAVLVIGLLDYFIRRLTKRKSKNTSSEPEDKKQKKTIDTIKKTQKSFRTLELLENPLSAGKKLGAVIYHTALEVKHMKIKNFFKWLWYNKEQLGSILFSSLMLVASQYLIWTKQITDIFRLQGKALIVVEVIIGAVALLGTILTIRNTCVKYGLSSLDTIDKVLNERAEEAAKALTPEQKKLIKTNIAVLTDKLTTLKRELQEKTANYEKLKCLHDADASLVENYEVETASYNKMKLSLDKAIATLETKIKEYSETLK